MGHNVIGTGNLQKTGVGTDGPTSATSQCRLSGHSSKYWPCGALLDSDHQSHVPTVKQPVSVIK